MGPVDQRGLAVVQLAGLIAELRIAAGAKEAARWWEAARWDQTVEVESTFAAVADQHGFCALCAVAQSTGQVCWDWWRRVRLGSRSVEDSQGRCGGRAGQAVAKAIELAARANCAGHAAGWLQGLGEAADQGSCQVLVNCVPE